MKQKPLVIHGATFTLKAQYQKDGCLGGASYRCGRRSIIQANYGRVSIRCCADERCMERAAKWARNLGRMRRCNRRLLTP